MPEPSGIPTGFCELFHNLQLRLIHSFDDHLGDPVTPVKSIRLLSEIYYRDHNLSAIIGIDGPG